MEFLVGHLLGDFMFQNDWMAKSKRTSSWVCLVHVVVYAAVVTLCAWAVRGESMNPFMFHFIAWPHFIIDRFGLARRWMTFWRQESFATGAMAPWSIVSVDQAMHAGCLLLASLV